MAGRLPTVNAGGTVEGQEHSSRAVPADDPGPWISPPCKQTRPEVPTGVHLHDECGRENEENRESDVF